MSADEVTVDVAWSRALLTEVSWLNMNTSSLPDGRRSKAVLWMMIAGISAIATILLFGPEPGLLPNWALGFGLGIMVMRLIVSKVHLPAMNRRRIERLLASPMYQGVNRVTFSDRGIESEQTLSRTEYKWAAVTRLQEGALALHLLLAETVSIPIPDAALPEGIDRAELHRRIEIWRQAARD